MITNLLYMNNPSLHTFMKILQNYYTTPISTNVPVEQEVNEFNTVSKPEKDEVQKLKNKPHLSKDTKRTAKR